MICDSWKITTITGKGVNVTITNHYFLPIAFGRRYGLTGTPLQNKLEEFWCVLDWANPGSLGKAKQFNLEYGKPIREGQTFDATKRELALGRKSEYSVCRR